jgi:hypothetical protein
MEVFPTKRRFQIRLSGDGSINHNFKVKAPLDGQTNAQLLTGSGYDEFCTRRMGVPLYICDVPCTTLGKKSRNFQGRFEVDYE